MSLEVGKNRMEAIGEVQETADLISWYCDQMAEHAGFDRPLPDDPLTGWRSHNRTVLKPHGVWAVIAPFNFPFALAGGPVGAALVAGNTVVFKTASNTAWSGRLLMDVFEAAGLPPGVLNLVSGAGAEVGDALMRAPGTRRRHLHRLARRRHGAAAALRRRAAAAPVDRRNGRQERRHRHPPCRPRARGHRHRALGLRPAGAEVFGLLAGLRRAAGGRRRCARGCSNARAAVPVGDPTVARALDGPGDRRRRASSATAAPSSSCVPKVRCTAAARCCATARWRAGTSWRRRVAGIAPGHRLWRDELFLPLVLVGEVDSLDEAITRANDSDYGLTAGFYGARDEIATFLDRIEAGVTYVNRPQGATTGAWPGYQPFGGWKGSGNTGKAIGSFWYLPLYLREQSQTVVD